MSSFTASSNTLPRSDTVYHLPAMLPVTRWPWIRQLNSSYEEAKVASFKWISSVGVLDAKEQALFWFYDSSRLAALAYPTATPEQLRTFCDMIGLLFIFDDHTDVAGVQATRESADAFMDGMRYPNKPRATPLAEMSHQFWQRVMLSATTDTQHRLLEALHVFAYSVIIEAQDREKNHIRSFSDYFNLRRKTAAIRPCFVLIEFGLSLPLALFNDPTIAELVTTAVDMVIVSNDIYSYNVEQARGDGFHNVVTVAQKEFNLSLDDAMVWLGEYHDKLGNTFCALRNNLPSFGVEYDTDVGRYVDGLAMWIRGNDCWSFEGPRYLGTDGTDIQRHRRVVLLPMGADVKPHTTN